MLPEVLFKFISERNRFVNTIVLTERNGVIEAVEPTYVDRLTSKSMLLGYPKSVVENAVALVRIRIENGEHKCCIEFKKVTHYNILSKSIKVIEWLLENEHLCESMLASIAMYIMSYASIRRRVKEVCGDLLHFTW